MTHHENLTRYKGVDVSSSTVSIRNTGDGLSHAMEVDPIELPVGSTVHVVLECEVEKHRHEPATRGQYDELTLVNMLVAGRATIVDAALVQAHLDKQAERIKQHRDLISGQQSLDDELDAADNG